MGTLTTSSAKLSSDRQELVSLLNEYPLGFFNSRNLRAEGGPASPTKWSPIQLGYATTLSFDESSSSDMALAFADAFATSGLMGVFTIGLTAAFSSAVPEKPRTVWRAVA